MLRVIHVLFVYFTVIHVLCDLPGAVCHPGALSLARSTCSLDIVSTCSTLQCQYIVVNKNSKYCIDGGDFGSNDCRVSDDKPL